MPQVTIRLTDGEMERFLAYREANGFDSNGNAAYALLMQALSGSLPQLLDSQSTVASCNPTPEPDDRTAALEQQVLAVSVAVDELRSQMRAIIGKTDSAPTIEQLKKTYDLKPASEIKRPVKKPTNAESQKAFDWASVTPDWLEENMAEFWLAMLSRAVKYVQALEAKKQKKDTNFQLSTGELLEQEASEVALNKVRKQGEELYQEWQQSQSILQWSDDYLTWKQNVDHGGMVEYRANVETHMEFLKLEWNHAEVLNWIEKAQEIEPFEFIPEKGDRSMPDWAVLKLSYDLDNAIARRANARG